MPLDSRRNGQKLLPTRAPQVSAEPTLRDIRTPVEPPSKRVLPWMGVILFCTGAVFQAGRLVERLDPQPPHKPGLVPGLLATSLSGGVPAVAPAPPPPPAVEKSSPDAEALRRLMAERDEAKEAARLAWQKQVEAEVAAQVARMGEASSQQKQLEADEVARKATQAAAEAEAKARGLEIQLVTRSAELHEAQLREENVRLRAELERARGTPAEGPAPTPVAGAAEAVVASPGAEVLVEPAPLAPAAALEAAAAPVPPSSETEPAPAAEPTPTAEPAAVR